MLFVATFGTDHRLIRGRIQISAQPTGLPLGRRYLLIQADDAEHARSTALGVLGPGGWSAVYPLEVEGARLIRRHGYLPLFAEPVRLAKT